PGPTTLFEFNPATNTTTAAPSNGPSLTNPAFMFRMLDLPSGQVLVTNSGRQLFVYTPDSAANAALAPTVTNIFSSAGTEPLTGTQLNGVNEGAGYGDDAQMASNYPIVQLRGPDNITRFARTFNWSSTGVATGSALVTTRFTMPAGAPT